MAGTRYKLLGQFLRPVRWRLVRLVLLTGVISVLSMTPPLLVRATIDHVVTDGRYSLLPLLVGLMLIVPALTAICVFIQVTGIAYVGQTFVLKLRSRLYTHLLQLSMRFYGRESAGKLVNRVMSDTTNVQNMMTAQAVQVFSDLICAAFAISASFALNWRLAMLLISTLGFFVLNFQLNIRRIRESTRGYRGADDRLSASLQSRLATNLTVKSFGTEEREHGIFQEQSDTSLSLVKATEVAATRFRMNMMLLRDLGRAVIYFGGCAMVLNGSATYGDVIAFTAYAIQLLLPAVRFSQLAQQIQDVGVSMDRIMELFDEEPDVREPENATRPPIMGGVVFDNVTFGYEPGKPVIRDFNLRVSPGETIAFVGPTGCGKTTLIFLLLRFFDPDRGTVCLDGHDLRELDSRWLRSHVGLVLQEPLLFGVSVADNIRYARPSATRGEVEQAARIAEIHDDIVAMPNGYDTMVMGRHGIHMSVGQKQRVSIARAVVADPTILIMDEATSSLDSESEHAIQVAMTRFLKDRTSFVVAHRLSTIRNADRILLMDDGRICEEGSHEELMAKPDGAYRELYLQHVAEGVMGEQFE